MINSPASFLDYVAQLREFMGLYPAIPDGGKVLDEPRFNQLALKLFELQFTGNASYGRFCQSRKITPPSVVHWPEIPAVPSAGFKEWDLTSLPVEQRTHVFHSSGTTEQRPSRHFHNAASLSIYEDSLLTWFAVNFSPGTGPSNFLFLPPPPGEVPHSSLVHMFETICKKYGSPGSSFAGQVQNDGMWNLDFAVTLARLDESVAKGQAIMVMGTAFNFVHLLDQLQAGGVKLQLPRGSRVLETGGYKGRSRSLPKTELHAMISNQLGVSAADIVCEYGMSELSSQAYDSTGPNSKTSERTFHFPPWARAQIISPETGREVGEGETGLVRIFDLANVYSVMAIQTEDLAIRRGSGFELIGRAALSEPRGCSLQSF